MSANPETAAPSRRKKIAQDKERSNAALGQESQNTSSPEGTKEGNALPSGWKWKTIRDLVSDEGVFIDGDWVESKDQDQNGDVRLIQLADVGDGVYQDKSDRFMTKAKTEELRCTFLKDGDVLIARMPDPLGRACIFPGDAKPSVTVVDVAIVRSGNGEFDHRWLACFVNAHPFRSAISGLQAGSTRKRISRGNLATIPLPVPPLPEQRRIVAEIEKQFTRLDAGVAALRRVRANLKRYRAAVLKAACEGRLVPTEAELNKSGSGVPPLGLGKKRQDAASTFETGEALLARILTERRKNWQGRSKYKEPAAHATIGLATLPEGWIWTTIGACFHVAVGATPSRKEASYWGGGIPWVSSGEVRFTAIVDTRETITNEGLENSSTQLNPKGSVLLGMIGEGKTRGQTAILKIDACNNQNCAAIWVSQTEVPPGYVYYWLWSQYDNTRRTSSGNNQPALNKARIEVMPLPLPPLAEQTRIVAEVERRLSVVEELEAVVSANLQRATRLRQSILQKAFTGNLL